MIFFRAERNVTVSLFCVAAGTSFRHLGGLPSCQVPSREPLHDTNTPRKGSDVGISDSFFLALVILFMAATTTPSTAAATTSYDLSIFLFLMLRPFDVCKLAQTTWG